MHRNAIPEHHDSLCYDESSVDGPGVGIYCKILLKKLVNALTAKQEDTLKPGRYPKIDAGYRIPPVLYPYRNPDL